MEESQLLDLTLATLSKLLMLSTELPRIRVFLELINSNDECRYLKNTVIYKNFI